VPKNSSMIVLLKIHLILFIIAPKKVSIDGVVKSPISFVVGY
jgi:hypothetical protein